MITTVNVYDLLTLVMFTTNLLGITAISWLVVFAPFVLCRLVYGLYRVGATGKENKRC